MRSSVPKHFHQLLGRRMVDWIIEAGTGRGRRSDRRRRLARDARRVRRARRRGRDPGDAARHRRRRPLCARRRSRATTATCSCCRATRRCSPLHCSRSSSTPIAARTRPRRSSAPSRADPRIYGRIVRGADGSVLRIVEGTDATEEEQQIGEINSSIYVFRSDVALAGARADRAEERPGRALPHRRDRDRRRAKEGRSRRTSRRTRARRTASTRASELAHAAAVLRDRINEAHMLAGVTIVDPATTWIDPTVEIEPDATIQPFAILRGATRVATGAEIGANTVADRRPHRDATRRSAHSVTFAPERSSATPPRRAPSWRSRTHASATARRCLTCRTSATPRSATTRTSAPARSRPTSRTSPASPRAARRSGATSGPASTMASSRRWRSVTEHGLQPGRS